MNNKYENELSIPWDVNSQDETTEEAPEIRYYEITNDNEADRAIRALRADRENTERIIAIGEAQKQEIDQKIDAMQKKYEARTKERVDALERYFGTVEHRQTKTTEKYDLLSGTLTLKRGKVAPKVTDSDALVRWLDANKRDDMVKTVRSPKWGELKKVLSVAGDVACIAETGEVVPGVEVWTTPDRFTVEF